MGHFFTIYKSIINMEKLKQYLRKYSWYRWCEANDLKAHYYVVEYLFLVVSSVILFAKDWYWGSLLIGVSCSLLVAFLKELLDDTGFSWEDIKNGLYGLFVGVVKFWIILLIKLFIEDTII